MKKSINSPRLRKDEAARLNGRLGGRPSGYDPKLPCRLRTYFDRPETERRSRTAWIAGKAVTVTEEKPVDFPTFQGFCTKEGIAYRKLARWAHCHPELEEAMEIARDHQYRILVVNGLLGHYSSRFTVFFAKLVWGWRD
jgi:hypothetical protein